MPSRWLCIAIVAFWLATSGWLFWQEIWPQLQTGQPPPFTIDLEEEAQQDRGPVRWLVTHNGRPAFNARTWIEYREKPDDSFALHAEMKNRPNQTTTFAGGLVTFGIMHSTCRISRKGELREMRMEVILEPNLSGSIEGEVHDGHFVSRAHIPLIGDVDLPPVEVSHYGSILQPYHPVNRIEGLRRGQAWRIPVIDPLAASLSSLTPLSNLGGEEAAYLDARVLVEPQIYTHEGKEYVCLVIEYKGNDRTGSTWVEVRTGLVLRQEMKQGDNHLIMERQDTLPTDD